METQLAVIGGGPGGYAAAFLAADLGMQVTLIEADPRLGGTCLLRGCIPSKALLHVARVISEAREVQRVGRPLRRAVDRHQHRCGLARKKSSAIARRRSEATGQEAQGHGHSGPRHFRELANAAARRGRPSHLRRASSDLRALHPGQRLAAGDALGVQAADRPRDGFDRRAWNWPTCPRACWSSAAATSAWRWAPSTPSWARRSPSSS